MSSEDYKEPKMSVDNIPDLNKIMEDVMDMVEFMNEPAALELKFEDKQKYDDMVYFKYREIITPKIINILLEDINNMKGIMEMFETLAAIKCGNLDIETETDKYAAKIENQYIYPKFGGKEKFFEMLKNNANKKS